VGHNPKSIPANILNKQNQIFLSHSPQILAAKVRGERCGREKRIKTLNPDVINLLFSERFLLKTAFFNGKVGGN
jgi:hypothetical protein